MEKKMEQLEANNADLKLGIQKTEDRNIDLNVNKSERKEIR